MSLSQKSISSSINYSQFTQFHQCIRSFCIRYVNFYRQKQYPLQQIQQIQTNLNKIAFNEKLSEENIINKILELQFKGDYHQVILLTLFQDLIKWTKQYFTRDQNIIIEELSSQNNLILNKNQSNKSIKSNNGDDAINQKPILSLLIQKSIMLLNSQQQFHTIVPKQNQLLRDLLLMPYVIDNLEHFRFFYRKLKDIKQFYPSSVKENQKIIFLKTIQQVIELICKERQQNTIKTLQFIFTNNFTQLQMIEENHQLVMSRLKIIKKIVRNIWFFNSQILYKSAYLIVKYSSFVLRLPHLFNSTISLYEDLMPRLMENVSPTPLIIFNHMIVNNIKKVLEESSSNKIKYYFFLQTLLRSLSNIFSPSYIHYFMKNYDANFMQEPVCHNSLNILFEFIQNRMNQKRYEYQIFKKYLKNSISNIRQFLLNQEKLGLNKKLQEKLIKFYEVKKKQYLQIIKDMNQKPKKIFKKLQSLTNKQIKQDIIKKYIRIAKKSVHFQIKAMIDVFAANNSISEELFNEYIDNLFTNLNKDVTLEEFLRYFSSNFFLNGQSQQVLRVLDKITQLFYLHQSVDHKIMKNSDSTYTFANAIILLNTDLHNPQNEQKMSLESFYKMCKKINDGQDLPTQLLSKVYFSIKKNKINTFRNKSNLSGISAYNFTLICDAQKQSRCEYYDNEMKTLTDGNFYHSFIYDTLSSIIDERETNKLQQLISQYKYNNTTYECEIIQSIRKLAKKKMHIPLHGLEKILQHANFKNNKTSEKLIQYFWLATNLIQNFHQYLPTNVICEVLIVTWRLRIDLKDNMYLRQRAEIKRIKKLLRQFNRRTEKKSIMDMFSNFLLSSKDEEQDDDIGQGGEEFIVTSVHLKKMNYKMLSERILKVLMMKSSSYLSELLNVSNQQNSQSNENKIRMSNNNKTNHRVKSIQFFINYLKNDEQKIFEEFISLLYLIFHLLYQIDELLPCEVVNNKKEEHNLDDKQIKVNIGQNAKSETNQIDQSNLEINRIEEQNQQNNPKQIQQNENHNILLKSIQLNQIIKKSSFTLSSQQKRDKQNYDLMVQDLFYQLLGLKQSQITKRIDNLRKKDIKKFHILYHYSCYWVFKILLTQIRVINDQQMNKQKQNNLDYLIEKCFVFLQKTDKQTFLDLLYQFESRTKQIYKLCEIDKTDKNNQLEHDKQIQSQNQVHQQHQINQHQQNNQTQNININNDNDNDKQKKRQKIIKSYLTKYRKLIIQMYKNGCRVIGENQFIKSKQYKWLITIYHSTNQLYQKQHIQQSEVIKSKKQIVIQKKQTQQSSGKSKNQINQKIQQKQILQQNGQVQSLNDVQKELEQNFTETQIQNKLPQIHDHINKIQSNNKQNEIEQKQQEQIKISQSSQLQEQVMTLKQQQPTQQKPDETENDVSNHDRTVIVNKQKPQQKDQQNKQSNYEQQYNEQQMLSMPIYLL